MRKTRVVIDDRLLEQVRDLLGTASIRDTIDRALREILRAEARRREVAALSEGHGLDLTNEEIMAKAWRARSRPTIPGMAYLIDKSALARMRQARVRQRLGW